MTDAYNPAFFDALADIEPRSAWFRERSALIEWTLRRCFPAARSLLEVGCGTGYVLHGLERSRPDLRLVGTELFEDGLRVARERLGARVELAQADARQLPWRDAFDVVGAFDVLEHIDADDAAMAGMVAAATPGGGLLITVPQHPWLWSAQDEHAHHERRYTRRELVAKLRRAGAEPFLVTSFISLPLPALAVLRLRRRPTEEVDPFEGLVLPQPVDAAFTAVLRGERALIRAGVRFPMGGSLLVAARRTR
jgi:SAM-dependent methyltransferase